MPQSNSEVAPEHSRCEQNAITSLHTDFRSTIDSMIKPGTPNKGTQSIRALLNEELPQDELQKLWHKYLYNKDLAIAFEAFKLANQYIFSRAAASPINEEDAPQQTGPQFDLSQIVTRHVPVTDE